MPSPVTVAPTGSVPYTGSTTDVPADRSDVALNVITGASPPRASSMNYTLQFFANLFQRIWKKAGFLDLASTWSAKQTFTDVDTTGTVNLNGGATVGPEQTLGLEDAQIVGGTFDGAALTSPAINGGTLTGTLTATGATIASPTLTGATVGGAFTGSVASTGNIPLSGSTPASTAAFSNTITPGNVAKAWAKVTTDGTGGVVVAGGFNIASATFSGAYVVLTFASAFAAANYAAIVTKHTSGARFVWVVGQSSTALTIAFQDAGGSDLNLATTAYTFSVVCFGAQ